MELFRTIRNFYFWIGINLSQSNQIIKIFTFSSLTIAFILIADFFLFEAKSVVEYGLSFYILSTVLFVLLNLLLTVLEMPNTLKLIERFEQFIEMSKSNWFLLLPSNFSMR